MNLPLESEKPFSVGYFIIILTLPSQETQKRGILTMLGNIRSWQPIPYLRYLALGYKRLI